MKVSLSTFAYALRRNLTLAVVLGLVSLVPVARAVPTAADVVTVTDVNACSTTNVSLTPPVIITACSQVSETNNAPASYPVGTNIVIWTKTDSCGNTATMQQRVIVMDTQEPFIQAPDPILTVSAQGLCVATNVTLGLPLFSDNCAVLSVTNDASVLFSNGYPSPVTLVTWTVTDVHGNTAEDTQLVIVSDTEPPSLICPANVVVSPDTNSAFATGVALGTVLAADNCAVKSVTNNASAAYPSGYPIGTNNVIWTAVDNGGNTATCLQLVVVSGASLSISTNTDLFRANSTGLCSATNVDLAPPPVSSSTCSPVTVTNNVGGTVGLTFNVGTNLVVWTATDSCGHTAKSLQRVIVNDTQKPFISCPPKATVTAAAGLCYATNVNLGTPLYSDNCGVTMVTSNLTGSSQHYFVGTNSVLWTVKDAAGNTNFCVQFVVVLDTEPPTVTCPPNVIVAADHNSAFATGVALGNVLVNDNCGVQSITNNAPASYPIGTNTVVCTAVDFGGNTATCLQHVVVTNSGSILFFATNADVIVSASPGLCFTNVILTHPGYNASCQPITITSNAPGSFPVGTNIVVWTATDNCGKTASSAQHVIVLDKQPPLLTCPADIVVQVDTNSNFASVANLGNAIANDNCSVVSLTNNSQAHYPIGTNFVTWTATDGGGNTATCLQKVVVTTNGPATITIGNKLSVMASTSPGFCLATNINLGATPFATSPCPILSVTNNLNVAFSTGFPVGTNVVTWTATDSCGSTATTAQLVIVLDTQPPAIGTNTDRTVNANAGMCFATGVLLVAPSASDACSGVTVTSNAPAQFSVGTNLVVWTATDGSGNTATSRQLVVVIDNQKPVRVSCATNITVPTAPGLCMATNVGLNAPVFTDNCGITSVSNNAPASHNFNKGVTGVIWTADDAAGNTAVCVQTVTVVDQEPPFIQAPDPVTASAALGLCLATNVNLGTPLFNDNCGISSVTNDAAVIYPHGFPAPIALVTWTATDNSGNVAEDVQFVFVDDTQKPTITCPPSVILKTGGFSVTNANLGNAICMDNCNVVTISNNAPKILFVGTNTVIWTAVDGAGNSNFCVQVVAVVHVPEFDTSSTNLNVDASGVNLHLGGLTGHGNVIIYGSTNLTDWVPLYTNPPVNGSVNFHDGHTTNLLHRYYKAEEQ